MHPIGYWSHWVSTTFPIRTTICGHHSCLGVQWTSCFWSVTALEFTIKADTDHGIVEDFLSRCPSEIGWVDVEPDHSLCVGCLNNWYCKACEKAGDATSDLNLASNPFLSGILAGWACLGRQEIHRNTGIVFPFCCRQHQWTLSNGLWRIHS